MEIDNLKSVWQTLPNATKNKEELNQLLKKNSNPILAGIRKQLIIEFLGFSAFLACYFSMFDGANKPLIVNLMIIIAIIIQLLNGYRGYLIQAKFRSSISLYNDLLNFTNQLKSYRVENLLCKTFFGISIIIFFTYGIKITENEWLPLVLIVTIFCLQLLSLNGIWQKRINRLKVTIRDFENM